MERPFLFRPAFIPENAMSSDVRNIVHSLQNRAAQEEYLGHFVEPEASRICQQRAAGLREMVKEALNYFQLKRKVEEEEHLARLAKGEQM